MLLRESMRSACDLIYRRNALRTVISITNASRGGADLAVEGSRERLWTCINVHNEPIANRGAVSRCGNELEHLRSTQDQRIFPVSWRREDLRAFDRPAFRDDQLDRARSYP